MMTTRTRFLLALALVVACRHDADEESAAAVVEARVEPVGVQPFSETIDAIGVVTGRPGASGSVSAPAAARVSRVLVAVGQRVAAGQPLVMLDQTTFLSSARSATAALGAAERNAERTRRLADEGILPRKEAEQAAAELERARADAAQASQQERLSTLRAPVTGVVTRVGASLGATADPTQPLVEIVDPTRLDLVLGVTPADAARIRPGMPVALSGGQSAGGESLGEGAVADVSAVVDAATRSVPVRVSLGAPRRTLRVGETVFARVAVRTRLDVVVVPLPALVPEGDGFKVFVVDTAGVAHERPVTVGARTATAAEITEGVRVGERVVTQGAYGVTDSAKVVPPKPTAEP